MAKPENQLTLMHKLKLKWYLFLRAILGLWVKPRVHADADGNIGAPDGSTVCYVLESYALSSILILDSCCEKQELDRPLIPIPAVPEAPVYCFATFTTFLSILYSIAVRSAVASTASSMIIARRKKILPRSICVVFDGMTTFGKVCSK